MKSGKRKPCPAKFDSAAPSFRGLTKRKGRYILLSAGKRGTPGNVRPLSARGKEVRAYEADRVVADAFVRKTVDAAGSASPV